MGFVKNRVCFCLAFKVYSKTIKPNPSFFISIPKACPEVLEGRVILKRSSFDELVLSVAEVAKDLAPKIKNCHAELVEARPQLTNSDLLFA